MGVSFLRSDLGSPAHVSTSILTRHLYPTRIASTVSVRAPPATTRAYSNAFTAAGLRASEKPAICTADELHYVPVPDTDWRLALWRYLPSSQGKQRNHPLLLLSGVGTNAIGYDLAPDASFARYMSDQGFDTWILELRGAGLSTELCASESLPNIERYTLAKSDTSSINGHSSDSTGTSNILQLRSKLTKAITRVSEQLTKLINEGFLEDRQKSTIAGQVRNVSEQLVSIIQDGPLSAHSPFVDLQSRFTRAIEDFQKQLHLVEKYNWDFDHYLKEDLPAAMDYIRSHCRPKDDKLLAIGHSMGGILLYATLSQTSYNGRPCGLASVITLGSSLDYTTSRSSLKYLLPIADPAQALNVRVIPLGALLAAAYPLAARPPYLLSWLNSQVSAENMMHSEKLEKLVFNNFCNIPAKLLLQLATAFEKGGLQDRSGAFSYKKHLPKSNVPILALAGDQDLICPPEAVYETIKLIPEHLVSYKVIGEPRGPHFGHYDLVGGRMAPEGVYPHIIEFLSCHDRH